MKGEQIVECLLLAQPDRYAVVTDVSQLNLPEGCTV